MIVPKFEYAIAVSDDRFFFGTSGYGASMFTRSLLCAKRYKTLAWARRRVIALRGGLMQYDPIIVAIQRRAP